MLALLRKSALNVVPFFVVVIVASANPPTWPFSSCRLHSFPISYVYHFLALNVSKDAIDTVEDADSALLASAMVMSDGAPIKEQDEMDARATKRLSLRRETVLQWLYQTTSAGRPLG